MCWCIRDACISIPECTQRLNDLTNSGGQHGQESEEGEEGEERSEEGCEEGFEEEVTRLTKIAGGLMPATSQEPTGLFASRSEFKPTGLWSTKEGVGETSGQTAGSLFSGVRSSKNRSGRRNKLFFVRCGSKGPQFLRRSPPLRFGPDVFADALVPAAGVFAARLLNFQHPTYRGPPIGRDFQLAMPAAAAMVIALPNGTVNRIPKIRENARAISVLRFR